MNAKVSILHSIRKLIPLDIMIRLYKAFILPHFEYTSPLFLGLSKGLSAKLGSTNAFALRTLLKVHMTRIFLVAYSKELSK